LHTENWEVFSLRLVYEPAGLRVQVQSVEDQAPLRTGKEWKQNAYSGIPLNGHSSTANTHDITGNSKSPDCPPIHFNTEATPE